MDAALLTQTDDKLTSFEKKNRNNLSPSQIQFGDFVYAHLIGQVKYCVMRHLGRRPVIRLTPIPKIQVHYLNTGEFVAVLAVS